jgi:hypothetical protein
MKLMWVETKRKNEMQAFFCCECNQLFDSLSCWSIQKSLAMHIRCSGHRAVRLLKLGEVEEASLRFIGFAHSRVDLLLLAQGKPQLPDVALYTSEVAA